MILQTGAVTHGHPACNIYSRIWLLRVLFQSDWLQIAPVRPERAAYLLVIGHEGDYLGSNCAFAGLS